MSERDDMPELPETPYQLYYEWPDDEDGYGGSEVVDGDAFTGDQMHAYARAYAEQRVREEREALLKRAAELHVKAGMLWPDAEELALSEAGIDAAAIDELIGECASSGLDALLTTPDDLRAFARAVLVHQPHAAPRGRSA